MKKFRTLRLPILLGLALGTLAAPAAFAQSDDSDFYGGLSVGQARAKIDDERITANLFRAGLVTTGMSNDERNIAYKVFGGYQVNRYLGVEGGYFNLGRFGFQSSTTPAGTLDGGIRLQGLNLDVVGTLPLVEHLSAFGKVGVQYARAHDNFSGTGAVQVLDAHPSKNAANYTLGIGLQYAVTRTFFVRAEAERYRIDDAVGNKGDVNLYSVSLVMPFGRADKPAHHRREDMPMPVAAAPIAVPTAPAAPVAPPPAIEPHRVSFAADSLFGFNRYDIKPAGKLVLEQFTANLKGTQYDVITVEGHTDRIGSAAANQKLSQRRANAVKEYLVASGIDTSKVLAAGKGESEPKTGGECEGSAATAKLVACLQPDRRVDVRVTGTR